MPTTQSEEFPQANCGQDSYYCEHRHAYVRVKRMQKEGIFTWLTRTSQTYSEIGQAIDILFTMVRNRSGHDGVQIKKSP